MAHISARLPQDFEEGKLTRRQLIQSLAYAATAASVVGTAAAADAAVADATDKVRATLEGLVRDTPEVGLQVAAYLDGKVLTDKQVKMLASLPSREALIAQVAILLNQPIQKIATVLNAPILKLALVLKSLEEQKAKAA